MPLVGILKKKNVEQQLPQQKNIKKRKVRFNLPSNNNNNIGKQKKKHLKKVQPQYQQLLTPQNLTKNRSFRQDEMSTDASQPFIVIKPKKTQLEFKNINELQSSQYKDEFLVVNWNCNGIKNGEKLLHIHQLTNQIYSKQADVIILQERLSNISQEYRNNYTIFNLKKTIDPNNQIIQLNEIQYSGVSILVKNHLRADALEFHFSDQIAVYQIYPKNKQGQLLHIIGIYNSDFRQESQFGVLFKELNNIIKRIRQLNSNSQILICGDFNFRKEIKIDSFYLISKDSDTRIAPNGDRSKLDYVFTDNYDSFIQYNSYYLADGNDKKLSDHKIQLINLKFSGEFKDFLSLRVNKHKGKMLARRISLSKNFKQDTNSIIEYLKQVGQETTYLDIYRPQQVNQDSIITKDEKILKFNIAKNSNDQKQLHSLIKNIAQIGSGTEIVNGIIIDNQTYKGQQFQDQLHLIIKNQYSNFQGVPSDKKINQINVNYLQFIRAFRRLDIQIRKKAVCFDGITPEIVKLFKPENIFYVFQLWIKNKLQLFQTARLIPLSKIKNKSIVHQDDIRIIAIQPLFTQIVEKIILKEINQLKLYRKEISIYQLGFKKNSQTHDHLKKIWKQIKLAQQFKNQLHILTVDCTKAFDSTNHRILLEKISQLRHKNLIEYKTVQKIRFILDKYYIQADNNTNKQPIKITRGNPQGSHISPLMWNIYINDTLLQMQIQHPNVQCLAFCDDLILSSQDINSLIQATNTLQQLLNQIEIVINAKKCEYMGINSSQDQMFFGNQFPNKKSIKYLGQQIDNQASGQDVVNQIVKKINFLNNMQRTNRLHLRHKLNFLDTRIISIIKYCAQQIRSWTMKDKYSKLQEIYKKVIQNVFQIKYPNKLLYLLNIQDVKQLIPNIGIQRKILKNSPLGHINDDTVQTFINYYCGRKGISRSIGTCQLCNQHSDYLELHVFKCNQLLNTKRQGLQLVFYECSNLNELIEWNIKNNPIKIIQGKKGKKFLSNNRIINSNIGEIIFLAVTQIESILKDKTIQKNTKTAKEFAKNEKQKKDQAKSNLQRIQ